MNLEGLRERVTRRLGFNQGSVDQDFDGGTNAPYKWIDQYINEAIESEYLEVYTEVGHYPFERTATATWSQSAVTFDVYEKVGIYAHQLISMFDVTDDTRGEPLWFGERFTDANLIWRDAEKMEWGESGPGSDKTIRFQYVAEPSELVETTDSPDIMPPVLHTLFVWAACCIARTESDEEIPRAWEMEREKWRGKAIIHLSQKRPKITGARGSWVRNNN